MRPSQAQDEVRAGRSGAFPEYIGPGNQVSHKLNGREAEVSSRVYQPMSPSQAHGEGQEGLGQLQNPSAQEVKGKS